MFQSEGHRKSRPYGHLGTFKVLRTLFILWVDGGCAAAWPVKAVSGRHAELDLSISEIAYVSVSDYSTVGVVDTVGSSPLRALVMQRLGNDIPAGIRLRVDVSKAIPLLQWQKQRGFSNVREHVLRKLGVKLKVDDLPPATATHGSMEERLVTQICLKENPNVSQEELTKMLCTRRALEDNLEENTHIDQWLLDETMATKDRAEQMKRQKEITVKKLSVKQSAFETRKLLDSLKPLLKNKKSRTARTFVRKSVERLRKSQGGQLVHDLFGSRRRGRQDSTPQARRLRSCTGQPEGLL